MLPGFSPARPAARAITLLVYAIFMLSYAIDVTFRSCCLPRHLLCDARRATRYSSPVCLAAFAAAADVRERAAAGSPAR